MTEKEAIERLKDHFRIHDDGRPTPYLDEAVSMAIAALDKQMSNGWIKCEDRLPTITVEDRYSDDVITVLKWYDGDITECHHWIKPKQTKMKNIKVAEADYDKAVKVLTRNKIEFK